MKIQNIDQGEATKVEMAGVAGCQVKQLISERDGAPLFAMRQFEVAPGGHTPHHHHPYEHEVYVIAGEGVILENETPRPIKAGDAILVEPDEIHQFRNTGETPLKFLCLVPNAANNAQFPPECQD